MLKKITDSKIPVILLGWLLVAGHYLLFSQFFPNAQGKLGHDYAYNLPMLLDGYYWFLNNKLLALPWFTPSFCGGMPQLANPATFYLSTTQFFTFLVGPLAGVKLTLLLFAALGFWGFYLLLARIFQTGPWPALLGGAIFLFNGFFTYRLIVGHLEFHPFMLVPLVALLLLAEPADDRLRKWRVALNVMGAALLIAYMFLAGMAQLMIPALMVVVVLALLEKMTAAGEFTLLPFWRRLALAGLISLGLSAAKLMAALYFLANFPRNSYSLPGVAGVWNLLGLVFRVLAMGGDGIESSKVLSNFRWFMERHEFEYGVGLVPFLLIGIGLAIIAKNGFMVWIRAFWRSGRLWTLGTVLLLLLVPLGLNYYTPAWNGFLKTVPIIRSLSNFLRWLAMYIPVVILLGVLLLDRLGTLNRYAKTITLGALLVLLGQNLLTDRTFYLDQSYDPTPIETGFRAARTAGNPPLIIDLVVSTDENGMPALTSGRNDALVEGHSQLLCYEPMFGFRLEFLPFKSSHPGPVLDRSAGVFNLKNPACYLFPAENGCAPGDHFRLDQLAEVENFIAFKPFNYRKPLAQRLAEILSLATLGGLVLVFLLAGARLLCLTRQSGLAKSESQSGS